MVVELSSTIALAGGMAALAITWQSRYPTADTIEHGKSRSLA
jgi:hypothetical protein